MSVWVGFTVLKLMIDMQNIRVVFRFLMVIPLLLLGIDGVQGRHHINESMFWTGQHHKTIGYWKMNELSSLHLIQTSSPW